MNFKYIIIVVILIAVVLAGVACGYFWQKLNHAKQNINKIACTMEAKLCPDGSYVSRTGPNCEFTECPAVKLSGITGIALLGPMCPVEKIPPDPKCADRPYKTDLVATSPGGTQIFQQFSSDINGKFSVDLPPGDYIIESVPDGKIFSHCQSQGAIAVEKNKYTNITLHCDTGIR